MLCHGFSVCSWARHLLVESPVEIGVKIILYGRQWEFQSTLRRSRNAVVEKKKKKGYWFYFSKDLPDIQNLNEVTISGDFLQNSFREDGDRVGEVWGFEGLGER